MNCEYVEATSCHAEFLSKHCGSFGKKNPKNSVGQIHGFSSFCCVFLVVLQHFLLENSSLEGPFLATRWA